MERYPTPVMDERASVLGRRFEALLLDGLLVALIVGILGYLAGTVAISGSLGGIGGTILALQFGTPVVLLTYQTVFEGYYGQTLGKRARSIVVVKEDGSNLGWGGAVIRNVLRVIDALPAFYLAGIVVAYLTEKHQRIGDVAGNTVVVRTE